MFGYDSTLIQLFNKSIFNSMYVYSCLICHLPPPFGHIWSAIYYEQNPIKIDHRNEIFKKQNGTKTVVHLLK